MEVPFVAVEQKRYSETAKNTSSKIVCSYEQTRK